MKYDIEQIKIGPLMRNHHAFYTELSIQNHTRENIVIVDCHNNKHVLPPATSNPVGRELVTIWYRATTNPTLDYNNNPQQVDGIRIVFSKHELMQDSGVFIHELNLLICSQNSATVASHPLASVTYEDAAADAREILSESISDAPTVKLIANDPENRYNKLYTMIGDMLVTIDVTHVYGEAELQILYFNKGDSEEFRVPLEEFLESSDEILELKDLPITFLSTNKGKAQRCATDYKRVSQTEVDEIIKRVAAKNNKDQNALKEKYETDIQVRDNEIIRLKDQLKTATKERDDNAEQLKAYKAAVNASNDAREYQYKEDQLRVQTSLSRDKVTMSNNDVVTSDNKRESAEKENKFKLTHLLLAAGLPVIGAIGLKLLEYMIKQSSK